MQGVDWSRAPDESAAESARLERSGNRYAAWPDQTDAESARSARQGDPYAYWPDQTGAESARLGRYENKARFLENAAKVWAAEDAASAKAALAQQHRGADAYRRELAEAAQRAKWDAMQAGAWSGRTGEGQPVWHAGAQPMAAAASGSDNRSALIAAAALGGEFSVLSADLPPDIASGYAGPAGAIGRDPVGSGVGLLKSAYNNTIGGLAGMAAKGGAYLEAGDMLWSGAVLGIDTREDAMALMRAGQAGEQLILAQPRSEGQVVGMAVGNTGFAMAATAGAVQGGVGLYNASRSGNLELAFKTGQDAIHYGKHGSEIADVLGYQAYSVEQYVADANAVVRSGTFVPELNGYVSIPGGTGSAKGLFVGLDRQTGEITTMHLKPVSWFEAKAPSLGWQAQPAQALTDTIGAKPHLGWKWPYGE